MATVQWSIGKDWMWLFFDPRHRDKVNLMPTADRHIPWMINQICIWGTLRPNGDSKFADTFCVAACFVLLWDHCHCGVLVVVTSGIHMYARIQFLWPILDYSEMINVTHFNCQWFKCFAWWVDDWIRCYLFEYVERDTMHNFIALYSTFEIKQQLRGWSPDFQFFAANVPLRLKALKGGAWNSLFWPFLKTHLKSYS